MSNQRRDDGGRFAEELTEQDILKVFDRTDEPFLTAPEIAKEFDVTRQAVTYRLKQMRNDGLVGRKETGASSVGWWAEVAPRLSDEAIRGIEESDRQRERGETVSMAEMKRRLGMDG